MKNRHPKTYCSFCGKSNAEVLKLIKGPRSVTICDECVDLCADIVKEARAKKEELGDA